MEIQRYGCDRLEVTIDASSTSTRDRELKALEHLIVTWKEKCPEARICSVSVTDAEEAMKVADHVDFLNRAQSAVEVTFDDSSPLPFDEKMSYDELALKRSHLSDLIMLAAVDGLFDQEEQKMVVAIGKKMGFSERRVNSIYNEIVLLPDSGVSVVPEDEGQRLQYLSNLCRVILADGKIDDWESVLIFPMAVKLGFNSSDVADMLEKIIAEERDDF